MPELARLRGEEYTSIRPLILVLCFVWGVIMGFALNYFRPVDSAPQPVTETANSSARSSVESTAQSSDMDRRYEGAPAIAAIEPAPAPLANARPSFDNSVVGPPAVVLTIEGGLTGRNARRLALQPARLQPAPGVAPMFPSMPLIPDLAP